MDTFYAEVKNAINKFTGEAFSSSKQLKKKPQEMERDKNGYCGHAEISKGQISFWEVAITKKHLNWGNRRQILQKKFGKVSLSQ